MRLKQTEKKFLYTALVVIGFIFAGCTHKNSVVLQHSKFRLKNLNCSTAVVQKISQEMPKALNLIEGCFSKYDRGADIKNLKTLLSQKEINLQCAPDKKGALMRAHTEEDPLYPGLSIYGEQFKGDEEELKATLFHESIHWLGYLHHRDVDITYISEICCLEHASLDASMRDKACRLFRFKEKKDFFNTDYLKEFAEVMSAFGAKAVAVDSAVNAARTIERLELTYPILHTLIPEFAFFLYPPYVGKISAETVLESSSLTTVVILNQVLTNAPQISLAQEAATHRRNLKKLYYSSAERKPIFTYLTLLGEAFDDANRSRLKKLTASWGKVEEAGKVACPLMQEYEKRAIKDLFFFMGQRVYELVESRKKQINSEAEKSMLTKLNDRWYDPCGE